MGKIKGWEKFDDYVWRQKVGTGYKYIWLASNNIVRIVDFDDNKNPNAVDLVNKSYIIDKFQTSKRADKFIKQFMRSHP